LTRDLLRRGRPAPWREAGGWWIADGSLVDLGCRAAPGGLTRHEGASLAALPGARQDMVRRDLRQLPGDLAWLASAFVASGLVQRRFYPHDDPPQIALVRLPRWAASAGPFRHPRPAAGSLDLRVPCSADG
jgi:hypothetical protein